MFFYTKLEQFSLLMMLKNNIKNNFSQIASTTMGQNLFSTKCLILCFFDQNQLFYAFLRGIFERNDIKSLKISKF
jgi:hypothetical protein